ncbi:MAG: FAD-dependent oxidoreductase [Saprospiraceae bacterium]|nr:FAD-dependent oxidoreductase [Saprospiraceae bacterium]
MPTQQFDVCIIGGGIIGLSSAYYLSKAGKSVAILDKGPKKVASSHGNCGLVSPSHVPPLNSMDLVWKSMKWMFQKDAPFYIKPQLNLDFARWMLGFVWNTNERQIQKSMMGRHQLLQSSQNLYEQLLEEEDIQCQWSKDGIIMVYKTEKGFNQFEKTVEAHRPFGVDAEPIIGEDLKEKEPALVEDVYGAWYYDIDAWVKPDELVGGIKAKLIENGVQFYEGCEIQKFQQHKTGEIKAVASSDNTFSAENYILAAGAWSPLFEKQLGLKIPILPGKGYSMTMKSPAHSPKLPCFLMERKVVATPWNGTYRLGSTMEFTGYDLTPNKRRLEALKVGAAEYLKTPYTDEIYEEWCGFRPMTNDGLPIIDRSPKQKNLWLASGHGMLGLSMGAGTGKLISEMIMDKTPHIDPTPYTLCRN